MTHPTLNHSGSDGSAVVNNNDESTVLKQHSVSRATLKSTEFKHTTNTLVLEYTQSFELNLKSLDFERIVRQIDHFSFLEIYFVVLSDSSCAHQRARSSIFNRPQVPVSYQI